MILNYLSPLLILTIVFIFGRLYIFSKLQSDRVCKNCSSADTERIARGAWIKKFLRLDHLHKIWCRKCGRIFYVRNSE
ncbi:MAG: hypothetical protein ACEQSR_02955 [Candidatus Methylacidiphilales bacterium]